MAKQDIAQVVTDKFIEALEAGTKPWERPWEENGVPLMPTNLKTGNAYSGINILLLWMSATLNEFESSHWLTYKQAAELGGQVRKGETGTKCIFYKIYEKEDKETGEKSDIPVMRGFTVFNLDQIDGIESPTFAPAAPVSERYTRAQDFINATGITIKHGYNIAAYSKGRNEIFMPNMEDFNTEADYWATLFHEAAHATAHSTRLDRELGRQGTPEYAFEELIAEISASMMMEHFGIRGEVQHECYVSVWLKRLGNDKRYIFKAATAASKVLAYFTQFDTAAEQQQIAA